MNSKRKAAQDKIIDVIDRTAPGGKNKEFYVQFFESMDDNEFHKFMEDLRDGKSRLSIFAPNFSEQGKITIKNNLKILRELGFEPYQRIWIPAEPGRRAYLSKPMLVGYSPITRQAQFLNKKQSMPKNKNVVDEITGQPTSESKGSKISAPEAHVLESMGLKYTLLELMKGRGGDEGMYRAIQAYSSKTGKVSIQSAAQHSTGVKSTQSLNHYLRGAHIGSTLVNK